MLELQHFFQWISTQVRMKEEGK